MGRGLHRVHVKGNKRIESVALLVLHSYIKDVI